MACNIQYQDGKINVLDDSGNPSKLYKDAVNNSIPLPNTYEGYSFHGYDTFPLSTETLTAAEILSFRDKAFEEYHSYPPFLEKIKNKFGQIAVDNIKKMLNIKLKRKIIEEIK